MKNKILFGIIIISILQILGGPVCAQNSFESTTPNNGFKKLDAQYFKPNNFFSSVKKNININAVSISPNEAFCNVAFFCRQELKLEKAIKVPVRFRLGSLEQANYYEGKR